MVDQNSADFGDSSDGQGFVEAYMRKVAAEHSGSVQVCHSGEGSHANGNRSRQQFAVEIFRLFM